MKRHGLSQGAALALTMVLLLSACGGGSSMGSTASQEKAQGGTAAEAPSVPDMGGFPMAEPSAPAPEVYGSVQNKVIRRASLTLQSTAFDAAAAALDALVSAQGGYYEGADVQQGEYYSVGSSRYGSYVVRVPREHYTAFLTAVGEVGHVVNRNESTEDVGEAYFDTEVRLRTQQTKYDRLLALLEQADKMEDILALESALAEVEYQIEQLSTQLRRYDSLIGYATITITLQEVLEIQAQSQQTARLSGRVGNALRAGLDRVGRGVGDLLVWAAYHLVGLIITLVLAVVALVLVLRRRRGRRAARQTPFGPAQATAAADAADENHKT